MQTIQHLLEWCETHHNQPYGKIEQLKGRYEGDGFDLEVYHTQKSVGANPASHVAIYIPLCQLKWPKTWFEDSAGKRGAFDGILRILGQILDQNVLPNRGEEGSGSVMIVRPGQKILERNTVTMDDHGCLEIRITLSFAGNRRSLFLGKENKTMLLELFQAIRHFIDQSSERYDELQVYVKLSRTHAFLQSFLDEQGGVAFVMNGSYLPRRAGDDDRPLSPTEEVIAFQSPASLEKSIQLPDGKRITGMVIPEGITLITGGGFHGKSTLLQAITQGIYPHIPGDGREMVVTRRDALFVCAEEGRSVHQIDISPFIQNLPTAQDTHSFSTQCASGSTSQAAAMRENIDAGGRLMLFDEDRTATNFMVSSPQIRKLIGQENEPIQPLSRTIQPLWKNLNISSILVVGGLGEFLETADVVIAVKNFCLEDVSKQAQELVKESMVETETSPFQWTSPPPRQLLPGNFNPQYHNQRLNTRVPVRIKPDRLSAQKLEYGQEVLDLQNHEQLIDPGQTLCIGFFLLGIHRSLAMSLEPQSIEVVVESFFQKIKEEGLDALPTSNNVRHGFYAAVRKLDIYVAINHMRNLSLQGMA